MTAVGRARGPFRRGGRQFAPSRPRVATGTRIAASSSRARMASSGQPWRGRPCSFLPDSDLAHHRDGRWPSPRLAAWYRSSRCEKEPPATQDAPRPLVAAEEMWRARTREYSDCPVGPTIRRCARAVVPGTALARCVESRLMARHERLALTRNQPGLPPALTPTVRIGARRSLHGSTPWSPSPCRPHGLCAPA